eukprot:gb/GEZN01012196.1/.p1 GENE.gb/GEZN01012196.1/~~gb/GEZN01012196.1/.p1  ORF type:complete len:300 (+),score=6.35 gb/GEZN01012196.1/:127-1026(+)
MAGIGERQPLLQRRPNRTRNQGRAVRINVLNQGVISSRAWTVVGATFFNLPQLVLIVAVLAGHWQPGSCDKPLHYWCLIYGLRLFIILSLRCTVFVQGPRGAAARFYQCCRSSFELFSFYWFIVGNIWLMKSEDCANAASEVYKLTLALILLNYLLLCLPCLIVICAIPLLCFSVPMVIDILNALGPNSRGARRARLESLPTILFNPDDCKPGDEECSICLCEYEQDDVLRVLPCNEHHQFHRSCADRWLEINASCPLCRTALRHLDNFDEHEANSDYGRDPLFLNQPPWVFHDLENMV